MATSPVEEASSEDEIFFGKITLKEIRRRILPKEKRRALNVNKINKCRESDTSIKIIEMNSEPEMNIENDWDTSSTSIISSNKVDCDINKIKNDSCSSLLPDDSFIKLEKQVDEMCMAEKNNMSDHTCEYNNHSSFNEIPKIIINDNNKLEANMSKLNEKIEKFKTPLKNNCILKSQVIKVDSTPKQSSTCKDIFKTPKSTVSVKKPGSSITKSRNANAYRDVMSPIAQYIASPKVAIIRNVKPKPLLDSHIPKFIKHSATKRSDKENTPINTALPFAAYRAAKETAIIPSSERRIPKTQLAKMKTSPSVTIRKHIHTEGILKKEVELQDDTINESLIPQPDLSIVIEKTTV